MAGHGTGRLQTDRIADLQIPIPQDPNEQRQYVAPVKALDDKIAVNDRIARKSFELSEVRYKQLISHATEVRPVGDLLDFRYGKALPEIDRAIGKVPVYGSGGITGHHDQSLVLGPGVIVGRKGTVGAVHWSEEDFFPIDTTFYVTLRRTAIPMEFIFFMLRGLGLHTMNSDSAVPGLNRSNALALAARLPSEDDIRIFHESVLPLFALRQALSAESVTLTELRDTLLPKLMSGAIRVRDAEKVVEEVT
jgi:type I restriction enzyme S subunit